MPIVGVCLVFWGMALIVYPHVSGVTLAGAKAFFIENLGWLLDTTVSFILDETLISVVAALLALVVERFDKKRSKAQSCSLKRLWAMRSNVSWMP